jgi:hypothetical protein
MKTVRRDGKKVSTTTLFRKSLKWDLEVFQNLVFGRTAVVLLVKSAELVRAFI